MASTGTVHRRRGRRGSGEVDAGAAPRGGVARDRSRGRRHPRAGRHQARRRSARGAAARRHRRSTPRAELLLMVADRAQHVAEVIRPALARGAIVVCDRYAPSTLAYQGVARGLGVEDVERLSEWATAGVDPDVVVVLDLPDDDRRSAGVSRSRPLRAGGRRLPRPRARRVPRPRARPRLGARRRRRHPRRRRRPGAERGLGRRSVGSHAWIRRHRLGRRRPGARARARCATPRRGPVTRTSSSDHAGRASRSRRASSRRC